MFCASLCFHGLTTHRILLVTAYFGLYNAVTKTNTDGIIFQSGPGFWVNSKYVIFGTLISRSSDRIIYILYSM